MQRCSLSRLSALDISQQIFYFRGLRWIDHWQHPDESAIYSMLAFLCPYTAPPMQKIAYERRIYQLGSPQDQRVSRRLPLLSISDSDLCCLPMDPLFSSRFNT